MSSITDRDLQDARDLALDALEKSTSPIDEDLFSILSEGRFNNRTFDDFDKCFIKMIEFSVLVAESNGRRNPFDDTATMKEMVYTALDISAAYIIVSDRALSDQLSDGDYNKILKLADKVQLVEDKLRDYERGSRSTGGRRDSRDNRSRGSRDVRDRGGRDSHNSRDRGGYTGSPRSRGTSSRGASTDKAAPSYRTKDRVTVEPHQRAVREPVDTDRRAAIRLENCAPVRKSPLKTPESVNAVFDPQRYGPYHVATSDGVVEELLEHKSEKDMEDYLEHELVRSAISKSSTGKIVVPQVDFRLMPDPITEEELPESKVMYHGELSYCNPDRRLSAVDLAIAASPKADYTVINVTQYRPFALPTVMKEILGDRQVLRTFEEYHHVLVKLQEKLFETEGESAYNDTNFLWNLNDTLTFLFNNLLAMTTKETFKIGSFINDFYDCEEYLKDPDNIDMYKTWTSMEKEYINNNLHAITDEERADKESKNILYPTYQDTDDVKYVWYGVKHVAVRASGELVADSLQIDKGTDPSLVDYKMAPVFHAACMKVIHYRNTKLSMANMTMIDPVGNQLLILAGTDTTPIIKVKAL